MSGTILTKLPIGSINTNGWLPCGERMFLWTVDCRVFSLQSELQVMRRGAGKIRGVGQIQLRCFLTVRETIRKNPVGTVELFRAGF